MSFWEKIKQTLRSFMNGRYGGDELTKALLWSGLILYILGNITAISLFALLGFAAYIFSIYRMFSRNMEKRRVENRCYLNAKQRFLTKRSQAAVRWKNRKEHKYFKCPKCRSWLKLPRKVGEVTVTCGRCKNQFTQKA